MCDFDKLIKIFMLFFRLFIVRRIVVTLLGFWDIGERFFVCDLLVFFFVFVVLNYFEFGGICGMFYY